MQKTKTKDRPKEAVTHVVSRKLAKNGFLEALYAPHSAKTAFAYWDGSEFKIVERFESRPGHALVPIKASNNLLTHGVLKLPSYVEDYGSDADLLAAIKAFIHRYVDLEPGFETVAAHYVLLSWVYDRFRELPYLRIIGDYGTGKTRFLQVVGSICYKPTFASGASTISPIFHALDSFGGTLVLDEADFRFSDAKAEITKILNNGNVAGFPVLRCEAVKEGHYDPRAFVVFGPKIVASRGHYSDPALESRFVSERARSGKVRTGIPANLSESFDGEAQHLRNQLLHYRFKNFHGITLPIQGEGNASRIAQIFRPLLAVAVSNEDAEIIRDYAMKSASFLSSLNSHTAEEQVTGIIADLIKGGAAQLAIKEITKRYRDRFGSEHLGPITPKWIGGIIRNRLHLDTVKRQGTYVIADGQKQRLDGLFARFAIHTKSTVTDPDCAVSKAQSNPDSDD